MHLSRASRLGSSARIVAALRQSASSREPSFSPRLVTKMLAADDDLAPRIPPQAGCETVDHPRAARQNTAHTPPRETAQYSATTSFVDALQGLPRGSLRTRRAQARALPLLRDDASSPAGVEVHRLRRPALQAHRLAHVSASVCASSRPKHVIGKGGEESVMARCRRHTGARLLHCARSSRR